MIFFLLLLFVPLVLGCQPMISYTDTKTLAFYHARDTISCNETARPQLRVTKRAGYQKSLSPVFCTNLNQGVPDVPRWECKSKYTLPDGYFMHDLQLHCEGNEQEYYQGSCSLTLKVWTESDDYTWGWTLFYAFLYFLLFLFVIFLVLTGNLGVLVVLGGGSGGGSGGSSSFV